MKLIPYINLPGNAEEAINFYKDVFGGKIEINRWSEMPPFVWKPNDQWDMRSAFIEKALAARHRAAMVAEVENDRLVLEPVCFEPFKHGSDP